MSSDEIRVDTDRMAMTLSDCQKSLDSMQNLAEGLFLSAQRIRQSWESDTMVQVGGDLEDIKTLFAQTQTEFRQALTDLGRIIGNYQAAETGQLAEIERLDSNLID
ncbi:MAG: hypothetical protein QM689_11350 [Oscillospiraceae bacterium]